MLQIINFANLNFILVISRIKILILAIVGVAITSCEQLEPPMPESSSILDGSIDGLTQSENLQFLRGDAAFNDEVFTTFNGLGPLFVATSCGSCHAGDGKGHPFTTLTRFGQAIIQEITFLQWAAPNCSTSQSRVYSRAASFGHPFFKIHSPCKHR